MSRKHPLVHGSSALVTYDWNTGKSCFLVGTLLGGNGENWGETLALSLLFAVSVWLVFFPVLPNGVDFYAFADGDYVLC